RARRLSGASSSFTSSSLRWVGAVPCIGAVSQIDPLTGMKPAVRVEQELNATPCAGSSRKNRNFRPRRAAVTVWLLRETIPQAQKSLWAMSLLVKKQFPATIPPPPAGAPLRAAFCCPLWSCPRGGRLYDPRSQPGSSFPAARQLRWPVSKRGGPRQYAG